MALSGPTDRLFDRLAPADHFSRLLVALALFAGGVPVAFYGLFALTWPIQMWMYVGRVGSLAVFLAGLFAVATGTRLAFGVAERAAAADSTVSNPDGRSSGDQRDQLTELQHEYAAGELSEEEFDEALDRLPGTSASETGSSVPDPEDGRERAVET